MRALTEFANAPTQLVALIGRNILFRCDLKSFPKFFFGNASGDRSGTMVPLLVDRKSAGNEGVDTAGIEGVDKSGE
jgi:hypothetical protein